MEIWGAFDAAVSILIFKLWHIKKLMRGVNVDAAGPEKLRINFFWPCI